MRQPYGINAKKNEKQKRKIQIYENLFDFQEVSTFQLHSDQKHPVKCLF